MSDGVSGIGSAPFNVGSDIHQQTQSRERIENHLKEQMVEKEPPNLSLIHISEPTRPY